MFLLAARGAEPRCLPAAHHRHNLCQPLPQPLQPPSQHLPLLRRRPPQGGLEPELCTVRRRTNGCWLLACRVCLSSEGWDSGVGGFAQMQTKHCKFCFWPAAHLHRHQRLQPPLQRPPQALRPPRPPLQRPQPPNHLLPHPRLPGMQVLLHSHVNGQRDLLADFAALRQNSAAAD